MIECKTCSDVNVNPSSFYIPRLEAGIDKLVYALYDLTPEEIEIVERKG